MIEKLVMTLGYCDLTTNHKAPADLGAHMVHIIFVMIRVVLPPVWEEYCCIQIALSKPYRHLCVGTSWDVLLAGLRGVFGLDDVVLQSDDPIQSNPGFRSRQLRIVPATNWASSGAGGRVVLLGNVTIFFSNRIYKPCASHQ